ncbi:MAG TPA: DUF4340 domain-containing protein [Polyangiaceae bacterium]|nr:DUF4340 domain-containing protein [Polyangiaceae bacterium]
MDQQKKLYVGAGILAVLIALFLVQRKSEHSEAQDHSLAGQSASLPKLELTEEVVKGIDRVVLIKPADADGGVPTEIELVKTGDEAWDLKKPSPAKANASNVKSLLDNLSKLSLSELITTSKDEYGRWGVSDQKGLHASFFKGADSVFDVYFGENGSRGQMTRLAKQDGVFAIKGFSKWLYERDAKGWRDKSMMKFDDKEVVQVQIENAHGVFAFEKSGESWTGKHGAKATGTKPIDKFQASKVDDLLRAYKSLSAMDFGDDKKPADVGLAPPEASVTITLRGGSGVHVLKLGGAAESSNRWAMTNASDQIYTISSWSAEWATADISKFQVSDKPPAGDTPTAHADEDSHP